MSTDAQIVTRWKARLVIRKALLATARAAMKRKPNSPSAASKVKLRREQVEYAERIIARHTAKSPTDTFPGSPIPGTPALPNDHETAGLAGFPARDYFAPAGSPCVSPATGRVTRLSGHDPADGPVDGIHGPFGWSVYIAGGGKTYFLTHMGSRSVQVGDSVRQGERIGTVGNYAKWGGSNHIHQGTHTD